MPEPLIAELGQLESPMVFDTKSGPLLVKRNGALLELDFPARPAKPAPAPRDLILGLGLEPDHVLRSERMWLCVYAKPEQVLGLAPNHKAYAGLAPGRIIVTAPGTDCDFVSRFFAPDAGIAEDPVTGSAHCTLMPYWAGRLGRARLHARQVSRRGGELWCELDGERVRIAGHAALYLRGRISV